MQDDWVDWLPLAEFTTNNMVSETTKVSPFFANKGHHPRMGLESTDPPATAPQIQVESFAVRMKLQDHLRNQMLIAQADHEEHANHCRELLDIMKVSLFG